MVRSIAFWCLLPSIIRISVIFGVNTVLVYGVYSSVCHFVNVACKSAPILSVSWWTWGACVRICAHEFDVRDECTKDPIYRAIVFIVL